VSLGRDCYSVKVLEGVTEDWFSIVSAVQPTNPLDGFVETPKD